VTRVAVVGAGASGLPAAKKLRDAGFEPVVLERGPGVGGIWRYGAAGSPVYRSTSLISSKRMTQYRELPIGDALPPYLSHQQALAYLERYARTFDLLPLVRLGVEVRSARRLPEGGWELELATPAGAAVERFAALVVASGHHHQPLMPSFPGSFAGELAHASAYREPEPYRDKRVVVVGAGNSGCDIAVELAGVAERVFHSLRRGYHYVPKFAFGMPADEFGDRIRRLGVPARAFQLMARLSATMVLGPPERVGLPRPDHRLFESHPIVNSQLYYALGHGRITPKPDLRRLDGDEVEFADGSRERVDVVLCATGYRVAVPFLDADALNLRDGLPVLFKNVFHPRFDDLFFVGFLQPNSGIWFLAELQAELVAAELRSGALRRRGLIRDAQETRYFDYLRSERHHLEVDYLRYERDLRRLLRVARGGSAGSGSSSGARPGAAARTTPP
jgi:hypothetical protein